METYGDIVLKLYDNLCNDEQSEQIIEDLDSAETISKIRDAIRAGIQRLREIDQNTLADYIESVFNNINNKFIQK
jgi:hypothetical protein